VPGEGYGGVPCEGYGGVPGEGSKTFRYQQGFQHRHF